MALENTNTCKENGTETLKVFTAPNLNNTIEKPGAAKRCKLYCASIKSCWGCTKICNETCNWNAVTECQPNDNFEPLGKQSTLQKLGIERFLR